MDALDLEIMDNANVRDTYADIDRLFGGPKPSQRVPSLRLAVLVAALGESLAPIPFPAPKATVRERVARFVLRRF